MGIRKFNTVRVSPGCKPAAIPAHGIIWNGLRIPSICPKNGASRLIGVTAIWYDDVDADLELIFSQKKLTLGTAGGAITASDSTLSDSIPLGNMLVSGVAATETGDLINSRMITGGVSESSAKSLVLHAGPDENDGAVYVCGINRATGSVTYTAHGLDLILAVEIL